MTLPKALFEASLSYVPEPDRVVTKETAEQLFSFFAACPLFRWSDAQNDCEDRANAVCLLLDAWQVPNYKGWVFSGAFLKRTTGSLLNFWNYHVAAALPVAENGGVAIYIIDPASASTLLTLDDWAHRVTDEACSYYLVRNSEDYIFHQASIKEDNWYKRNRQNYKWTIQGLAGINGVSPRGKAQLVFNKIRIKNTERAYKDLLANKPF